MLYDKFKDCGSKKDVVNSLNDFLEEFVSDNEIKVEWFIWQRKVIGIIPHVGELKEKIDEKSKI